MKKLVYMLACALAVLLLAVPVFAQEGETLDLKYDDRKSLAELLEVDAVTTVAISNEAVSSYKIGTETPDAHVLHYEESSGTLYAVGVGTAILTVDGTEYAVTVEPAVISLIMYTGHSVGHGACGDATQSVVVEAGQAYSIYDPRYVDFTQVEGYGLGWGSEKRVSNKYQYVTSNGNNHIDAFAPGQNGTRGAGAALAWQWNDLTGEKLWVLNTAVGGSCLNEWMPDASWHSTSFSDYYNTAVKMYTYAQSIIKNEIAAGHYELGHMGLLYYCGANDKYYPAWNQEKIEANYETLWNSFSEDLSMDVDGDGVEEGPEYMGLVPYWLVSLRDKLNFDKGSAQFMASSAEYPHLFIASNMLREFMWDENLGNFPAINYTTQSKAVTAPTSVAWYEGVESCVIADDNSHPTQVAYNAIGIDTANNLYAQLAGADNTVTALTLIDESFNELTDGLTIKVGEPCPVAPWFEPFTADNLSYSVSGNAELIYPLQLVGTAPGIATLTVSQNGQTIKTLTVNVVAGHGTHCVCGGTLEGAAAEAHGTCDGSVQYVPLDTKWLRWHEYTVEDAANEFAKVLTGGSYYLEDDFTWSGMIYVAPGETVNICLNGHKLSTTGRAFEVHGTLNICDCQGGGQVYSPVTYYAPVAYVRRGGTWNIYGGSYSAAAPVDRDYAGVACVSCEVLFCNYDDPVVGGYINLYGGTLYGSELKSSDEAAPGAGSGGCILVRSTESRFSMYGGTLSGGSSLYGVSGITSTVYPGGIIGSAGTVELWGGTIENSTDPVAAVYGWGGTVTLKGDVNFKDNANADIYVTNTAASRRLVVEAKQSGTVVVAVKTPSLIDPAVLVSEETAENIQAPEGYYTHWQDGKLYVTTDAHFSHCVCGGNLTGAAATAHGACGSSLTWEPLSSSCTASYSYAKSATTTGTVNKLNPGNYYLEADLTWSGVIYVAPGDTVNICLNGHTLTTTSRSFSINGTLNICDCKGGGQVYSKYASDAPVAYVCCCGTWNVYGGSYSAIDSETREYGGVVCAGGSQGICDYTHSGTNSTIRLYDGIFNGCELSCKDGAAAAAGNGGCVNLRTATAYFYMYGGTLSGGKSLQGVSGVTGADYGGGIIGSAGVVELWGGKITGSTDTRGAVYGRSGSVSLKGSVTFENNGKADIAVHPNYPVKLEAEQNGNIVFNMLSPGTANHAVVADYDKVGCIETVANYTAVYQDSKVYIVKNADLSSLHTHCVCGGKAENVGDHTCGMPILYTAWTDSSKLPTSGYYYLDTDVVTSTRCEPTETSLHLCLNGKTVTNSYKAFKLTEATVDMCDCNESEGSIISSSTGTAALISTTITNVTAGSSFNLYSGKLIHTGTVADVADVHYDNGTVGYRIDEAPIQIGGYAPTNAQCIMRMYGGTVQGGTSRDSGAAIQVQASSSTMGGRFYMYGGTVIGGKAVNDSKSIHGGALSLRHKDSQAFIYGGTITGGEAGGCGGNIFVERGKLWLYGGTITGGKAGMNGGNLYVNGADAYVYLKGNTVFEAADAGSSGSNIYVAKGTVEMENGTVKGTDPFCVASGDLLEISGGTFMDGLSVEGATVKSVLAADRILVKTENNAVVLLEEDATDSGTESVIVIGKPQVNGDLKFGAASVSLHNDLGVNFKVSNTLLTEGGYSDPFVVFQFGSQKTMEEAYIVDASGRAVFRFRDIAPHMIGDTVTATLYATKDGVLYMGEPVNYSVKQYCYNMLGTYNDVDYPSAAYGELRTLLVDLLNYCSAAQQYVTYNTDSLANAKLLDKQKAWGTQEDREPVSVLDLKYATVENPSVTWVSGGLRLEDSVTVRYTLATESLEGLTVKVQAAGKEYVIDSSELVSTGTVGQYYLYFDRLNAAQMSEEILVTAYKGDAAVSNTVRYSIESYVAADDGDEAKLTELVKAMLRYGDAAKAYVN